MRTHIISWNIKMNNIIIKAEEKLSIAMNGVATIEFHHSLNKELMESIIEIESTRFREELRYSSDELMERSKNPGFTCLIVRLDGRAIAFDFGFNDAEEGAYFSDSAATLIERKGVGSILTAVEVSYCYYAGYKRMNLITEEEDQEGRRLVDYWGRFGFSVVSVDSEVGVVMKKELVSSDVSELYDRYLK